MQKIEREKIKLAPLNLDQIRLQGHIIGPTQNKPFHLNDQQIRILDLMKRQYSIYEISQTFIQEGKLISFLRLKELMIFLCSEGLIENNSVQQYFKKTQVLKTKDGFFDQLFKQEKKTLDVTDQIRKLPFFRSLSPEIVNLFLSHHSVVQCPAGIKVCQAGQLQRSLLCVLDGALSVFKTTLGGELQNPADISAGSVFGETGFFLNQVRTADVITTADSLIVKFKYVPEIFDPLIQKEKAQALQKRIWLIHALLASSLFKGLPDDCFDSLIYAGQLKSIKNRTPIFYEGDPAESFFILIQGSLEVLQNKKNIRHLKQGDCFGEIALLLTGGLRTASIVATADSLLLEISAQSFYQLLSDNLFLACEFEALSIKRVQADQLRQ